MTRIPWRGGFVALFVVVGLIALAIDEGWSVNLAECRAGLQRERDSQSCYLQALETNRVEPADIARRCEKWLRPNYWYTFPRKDADVQENEEKLFAAQKQLTNIDREIALVSARVAKLDAELAAIPEQQLHHPSKLRQFIAALFRKDGAK